MKIKGIITFFLKKIEKFINQNEIKEISFSLLMILKDAIILFQKLLKTLDKLESDERIEDKF